MAPFNALASLNGLETAAPRMGRHFQDAMAVARYLEAHPKVNFVNYPGLESNPYHNMIKPQMKGCGSLMSFELKGNYEQATRFIDALMILTHATHLGTCRSIVTHPASTTHSAMGEVEMRKAGISPSMIRFSIGIEDEKDLIGDLAQAFDKIDSEVSVKEDFSAGKFPQAY